jgi:peptidyl-prolyl cis-trans isomerase C
MSRFFLSILAALAAASALAQNAGTPSAAPQKEKAAAPSASSQNVAVVDGKPITKANVDQFLQLIGQPDTPELRERIKDELIEREVFYQEAAKRGIQDRPDVKFQADLARKSAIIQNLFRDEAKKHPVTDAQIQAEYDKEKAAKGEKEYHARHILVEKEDEAKEIITELKKGAKFEELAKKSKDPGSGARGGDLGWAAPSAYVKPFSDAMVKLEKGKFTESPVQTQFGYHVIELEDVRDTQFPPLDQVKTQIAENLQKSQAQAFAEDLKKKAKIQ